MMLRISLLLILLSHTVRSTLLGWVESPGYPSGYLPHASLNWSRCAPKGHTISIRFIHLDLEDSRDCENDAVKVFSDGNLISVLCGKKDLEELQSTVNPSLLSSPGGCLSLSFHSDYSNTKRHTGFRGFYSDQDFDECEDDPDNGCTQFCHNFIGGYLCSCRHGYHLDKDKHTCTVSCSKDLSGLKTGDVSSPSWPASYAENSNCQYTLSVEKHLQLELHFSDGFDVEQNSDGQCIDTVRVETPSRTLGPFCGETPPPSPLLTHSSNVKIHFTSDSFGTNKGFSLHFQTRDKVCLAEVTPHSTTSPQQTQYPQDQTVTVTCDLGYVVNTLGTQDLSTKYETTCQNTGVWTPNYNCEPVDCSLPSIPDDGILQLVGSDITETQYNAQITFNCSSKYYKLEGDETYTCSANGEWVSSGGKMEMPKCVEVCGTPEKHTASAGRILGGKDANLGEIPWHLLIKEPKRGGASLINDRWAVTAAHVVEDVQQNALRMFGGLVHREAMTNRFSNVAEMGIERIIIHPHYNTGVRDRTNFDNDIALIRLASRVALGPNILPICLPEGNRGLLDNEQGTVSGWGMTEGPQGFHQSSTLKYVDIGVYSLAQCQDTPYTKSKKRTVFTNNMFCAGATGKDSCQKDSGGPFVLPVLSEEGPYYLTGIVSWGPPCRDRQYKGYYTKVENYVDWIKTTIDAVETSIIFATLLKDRLCDIKVSLDSGSFAALHISSLKDSIFNAEMGLMTSIIWFLFLSMSECWRLPEPDPPMHGEVQSPQYPQPYPPNMLEQWDLRVPEGYRIRLTFTHLDIEASAECHYDALTVLYDEKVLGKFCGHENSADVQHPGNQPMLSPGNKLTLIFQSDNSNPERHQNLGFSAQYQAIDIDECSAPEPADGSGPLCSQICLNTLGSYLCSCHHGYELRSDQRSCMLSCGGGIFDEPEGHLFSPGYPKPPLHAVSCQYIISVEHGFVVSLNFTDNFHIESMDTEQGPNCLYHWLQVTIPDREPVKLCGGKSPGVIETNSNTVRLDYHTDDDGLSLGWSLDYSTHRVKCPFPGNLAKGRVTPILTEYFYRDYISVRCDQGYKLMMSGSEIDSFSAMCQNNGQWHLPLPECQIIDCGEPEPLLNGGVTFLSGFQNQYLSVVQYNCNEPFYSLLGGVTATFTCEADRNWRSNNNIIVRPACIPVCGKPTEDISNFQRIIGGVDAPANTIPWQVLLNVDGGRGGGMVIGDKWIMTAAHVLKRNRETASTASIKIYMGGNFVNDIMGSMVNASSVHIHPDYNNPNNIDYNNDIALIKLQNPLTFNSSIMPICLPGDDATYVTGIVGVVSGFGQIKTENRRQLTNRLKYVELPLVEQGICHDSIDKVKRIRNNVPTLTNNMFCAGIPEGGKDSCQGDSGGPFALMDNERFWAAGIVSWGVDCGRRETYGVYTRVLNYIDWINKVLKEN
ncbi:ovochymase [Labrus bergylta]|uniref:ovochymase n=1 Tax=Labrus bergylta TaxID=56723 RepID=UPI003313DD25